MTCCPDTDGDVLRLLQDAVTSLPVSGLDLWWLPLPPPAQAPLLQQYAHCLSAEELQRLQSRRVAKGQLQFVFTRVMLRHLLSSYHPHILPAQWLISKSASGRPCLSPAQSPLSFNLTHSDDCLIIAFSQCADPGVDIESLSRVSDVDAVARRYFSAAEYAQLQQRQGAAREEYFYRLWTLKEAAVKASGLGLAKGLQQFEFSEPGTQAFAHNTSYAQFSFWSACIEGSVVAAALMSDEAAQLLSVAPTCRRFDWPDTLNIMQPAWSRSYSKNSSTNLEP